MGERIGKHGGKCPCITWRNHVKRCMPLIVEGDKRKPGSSVAIDKERQDDSRRKQAAVVQFTERGKKSGPCHRKAKKKRRREEKHNTSLQVNQPKNRQSRGGEQKPEKGVPIRPGGLGKGRFSRQKPDDLNGKKTTKREALFTKTSRRGQAKEKKRVTRQSLDSERKSKDTNIRVSRKQNVSAGPIRVVGKSHWFAHGGRWGGGQQKKKTTPVSFGSTETRECRIELS